MLDIGTFEHMQALENDPLAVFSAARWSQRATPPAPRKARDQERMKSPECGNSGLFQAKNLFVGTLQGQGWPGQARWQALGKSPR
jgi:hypothetical protein